jgi:hypothetical protein
MDVEIINTVIKEAVSLFVLLVVLLGVYRLTTQFILVMSKHIDGFGESLERIANALENREQ